MTLTADAKKRVVIPGAAPGDVFKLEKSGSAVILQDGQAGSYLKIQDLQSLRINVKPVS